MSKKKKYISPLSWARFLALWLTLAVGIAAISPIVIEALTTAIAWQMPLTLLLTFLSLPMWLIQAWGQAYLLRRLFQRPLKYWVPVTVAAMGIGMLLSFAMPAIDWATPATVPIHLLIRNLPILILPALAQWVILRGQVRRAWIWLSGPLASAGLYLLYAAGSQFFQISTFWAPQSPMMTSTFALVTGLVALLLAFTLRRDDGQLKQNDRDADDQPEIERLVDDARDKLEDGPHPAQQRRAQSY